MGAFANRHIGIRPSDVPEMLRQIGAKDLDSFMKDTLPEDIVQESLLSSPLLESPLTEGQLLELLEDRSSENQVYTSYLGEGWYDCFLPPVLRRNVLENPGWYTSYTPYQAEISQGRLEGLFHFQTLISDLTGLPLANASLLDDATAAAEAAWMLFHSRGKDKRAANTLFVDHKLFAHVQAVLKTRCLPQGIQLEFGNAAAFRPTAAHFAVVLAYPNADGQVEDWSDSIEEWHEAGLKVAMQADLLALCLLKTPAEMGADVAFGSSQRFGIPMGFGGPYAAYFAATEAYKRDIPGRIIGLSKDKNGKPAYRMALQTREQHIKREKATSNICTANALMANLAAFYALYHGAEGLRSMAARIHGMAAYLSDALSIFGYRNLNTAYFDTLLLHLPDTARMEDIQRLSKEYEINLAYPSAHTVRLSLDETTDPDDLDVLLDVFAEAAGNQASFTNGTERFEAIQALDARLLRKAALLPQDAFDRYASETAMMRYLKQLENKDLSLTQSMIPLGSCTMKLNAAAEMIPITFTGFAGMHPHAPKEQAAGNLRLLEELKEMLCSVTGFAACSLQPTSGASGEYAGLRTIRAYWEAKGESHRNKVLIPASAHGTNPASAVQAGYTPITVRCDAEGNIDWQDWCETIERHSDSLAACMITYPSTYGLFESRIRALCDRVHQAGALVYMDGANMNAQVGWTSPGFIGADICHLNLHKTFAMPHGGGGPGAGPICCTQELADFLPEQTGSSVSAAPYGHFLLYPISYAYLRLLGASGLRASTQMALLSANYIAKSLEDAYPVRYTGEKGRVGHEVIFDCSPFKSAGITETDVAKRLMDYGFHAPTLSFPVHGCLMVEPTESEPKQELDRFIEAMRRIRLEIQAVETGAADAEDNVLRQSPHAAYELLADTWAHPYSRSEAGDPAGTDWVNKFAIAVARVDNAFGDRNLICSACVPNDGPSGQID